MPPCSAFYMGFGDQTWVTPCVSSKHFASWSSILVLNVSQHLPSPILLCIFEFHELHECHQWLTWPDRMNRKGWILSVALPSSCLILIIFFLWHCFSFFLFLLYTFSFTIPLDGTYLIATVPGRLIRLCFNFISVAMTNTKINLGEDRSLFGLQFQVTIHPCKEITEDQVSNNWSRQNVPMLPAYFLCTQLCFSTLIYSRDPCPGNGVPYSGLGQSTTKITLHHIPTTQSGLGSSSVETQVIPGCIRLRAEGKWSCLLALLTSLFWLLSWKGGLCRCWKRTEVGDLAMGGLSKAQPKVCRSFQRWVYRPILRTRVSHSPGDPHHPWDKAGRRRCISAAGARDRSQRERTHCNLQ